MNKDEEMITRRRKIKISHILLLLLVLIVMVFAFYRLNLRKNIRSRQESARAAGYPVTFEELNVWYSMPNGEENAAYVILDAAYYYKEPNDINKLPVIGSGVLPGRTDTMDVEMKDKISLLLSENQKCLELLHKISDLEYGCYPVDFTLGLATKSAPLSEIRHFAQLLELEAVQASEYKQSEISLQAIKSIIGVAGSINNEPLTVSQLVRISCQSIAVSGMEYAMNRVVFSDEQLKSLSVSLARAEKSQGMSWAVIGERIMTLEMLMHPRAGYFDSQTAPSLSSPFFLVLYQAIGLNESDAIAFFDYTNEVTEAFKLLPEQRLKAVRALNAKIIQIQKRHILLDKVMPAFGRVIVLDLSNIAKLRAAQAALAVQRYRQKNNKLPDVLKELVPEFLDSVPLDPFDGQEIRYKKLEKGFMIYSIGENLIDDGGKELSKDRKNINDSNTDITFIIEK